MFVLSGFEGSRVIDFCVTGELISDSDLDCEICGELIKRKFDISTVSEASVSEGLTVREGKYGSLNQYHSHGGFSPVR
jgi:hypothetical protein